MFASCLVLLAAAGCADAPPTGVADDAVVTVGVERGAAYARRGSGPVEVEPGTPTLQVGSTLQMVARRSDGTRVKTIRWSSSTPAVANVSESGLVTGIAPGTATITGYNKQGSASTAVAVVALAGEPAPVEPIDPVDPVDPTDPTDPTPPPTSGKGIWMSPAEIAALPTSGAAWSNLKATADGSCGTPDLANQDQDTNVCVMAKALVFARTGVASYRTDVVAALRTIAGSGTYDGRALALGRELAAYVVAADLIGLAQYDAALDGAFRTKLRQLLTTPTTSGPSSLVDCHEKRANNWGTHCGASRAAVAAYLGDRAELDRVATVFRGWVGDRSAYAGFKFGSDLTWACNPSAPVGINPKGCIKDGHSIDGVIPDDQRREGSFTWPAPKANYVWGALNGAVAQALFLHRQGYPAFEWSDRALLRAVQWLHTQVNFPASGDDAWVPHVVNRIYGTGFPEVSPASPGKNLGWTDWTH
jgi:hypothetical protein